MASSSTTKKSTSSNAAKSKSSTAATKEKVQVATVTNEMSVYVPVPPAAPVARTDARPAVKRVEVKLTDIVYVQSCFHGDLFYKSKRNGSIVEWQTFGAEQPMDVDELMYMRNTQPTFFKEPWIRLVGENADDVFEFLHLDRYCKNNLKFDTFDDVFDLEPAVIEQTVREFTPSLRESFARRAEELIKNEELNDLKKIKAIEAATNFELLK